MMKRRHFNLIKTGRKSKLALAVGLASAMSAMGACMLVGMMTRLRIMLIKML